MADIDMKIPGVWDLFEITRHSSCKKSKQLMLEAKLMFWRNRAIQDTLLSARQHKYEQEIMLPCKFANAIASEFALNNYRVHIETELDEHGKLKDECNLVISWRHPISCSDESGYEVAKIGSRWWTIADFDVLIPRIDGIHRFQKNSRAWGNEILFYEYDAIAELKEAGCFDGFHLPTEEEWAELASLCGTPDNDPVRDLMAFPYSGIYQEKSKGTSYYWIEKEEPDGRAKMASISASGHGIGRLPKSAGCSLRLVKDG